MAEFRIGSRWNGSVAMHHPVRAGHRQIGLRAKRIVIRSRATMRRPSAAVTPVMQAFQNRRARAVGLGGIVIVE